VFVSKLLESSADLSRPRWRHLASGYDACFQKLVADSAYQGPLFANRLAKILPCLKAEIIKRSDQSRGFVRSPERWIVERTIAWLNRCRGLAKDCENLNRNALAFLKLASIRFMLRKLYNELRVSAAASAAETLNSFLRSQALTGDLATDRFPGHGFAGASDGLSYWSGLPT